MPNQSGTLCASELIVGGWRTEQVATDGGEVDGGSDEDKAVPDSVCERYDAVTLEEHNTDHVYGATSG